jgi:hypothetical protein
MTDNTSFQLEIKQSYLALKNNFHISTKNIIKTFVTLQTVQDVDVANMASNLATLENTQGISVSSLLAAQDIFNLAEELTVETSLDQNEDDITSLQASILSIQANFTNHALASELEAVKDLLDPYIVNGTLVLSGEGLGPQGETGATGPQGEKGDKGDTGETGPQGASGADISSIADATIPIAKIDPDSGVFDSKLIPTDLTQYAQSSDLLNAQNSIAVLITNSNNYANEIGSLDDATFSFDGETIVDAIGSIHHKLSTEYATIISLDSYAKSSAMGSTDLSAINPLDSDHSATKVISFLNSKFENYALAEDLDAVENAGYAQSSSVALTYATKEELTPLATTASLSSYAPLSALSGYTSSASMSNYAQTSVVGSGPISGTSAKECITSNNGRTFTSISSITSVYSTLQGQNEAMISCAKYASSHANENIYLSSNGLLSGCTGPLSMSDAYVTCLASITE